MSTSTQIRNARPFRGLAWLSLLASLSLGLTLATRDVGQLSAPGSLAAVRASSVAVPWQKLQTNAVLSTPPVILAKVHQVSEFRPPVPDRPTPSDVLLDDSLHNRPPPAESF